MRSYCKVIPQFWTGETGRKLRGDKDAQILALYILTCPSSNMIGLYYLPFPTVCHETGINKEGASKALRRISEGAFGEFAYYDLQSDIIYVPEMAKYQIGESLQPKDKRIKAIVKILDEYHKCQYAKDFYDKYKKLYHLPDMDFSKPLRCPSEGPSMPLRSQEQEQEQEQEQDIVHNSDFPVKKAKKPKPSHRVPSGFVITSEMRLWAKANANGVDVDKQTAIFKDHEFKNPHSDWMAVWRNWIRREPIFSGKGDIAPRQYEDYIPDNL